MRLYTSGAGTSAPLWPQSPEPAPAEARINRWAAVRMAGH
jgi:hypothetical protein